MDTQEIKVTYIYLNDNEYLYDEKTSRVWDFNTKEYIGILDYETEKIIKER